MLTRTAAAWAAVSGLAETCMLGISFAINPGPGRRRRRSAPSITKTAQAWVAPAEMEALHPRRDQELATPPGTPGSGRRG